MILRPYPGKRHQTSNHHFRRSRVAPQREGLQVIDRPQSHQPAARWDHDRKQGPGPMPFVDQLEAKLVLPQSDNEIQIRGCRRRDAIESRFGYKDKSDAVGSYLGHRLHPYAGLIGQGAKISTDAAPSLRDKAAPMSLDEGDRDRDREQNHDHDDDTRHQGAAPIWDSHHAGAFCMMLARFE
jgi:hypothetical protein